jgi:hypothetical protein
MSLKRRIDKLFDQVLPHGSGGARVDVVPEFGAPVERRGSKLILRVDPTFNDHPERALTDQQRALIGASATVYAKPRVRLPDSNPSRLLSYKLGSRRIEIACRDEQYCQTSSNIRDRCCGKEQIDKT